MDKNEKKASWCRMNAQTVRTFLKSREVATNIPNQGEISIRQELFSDSLSTVAHQDDYVIDCQETYLAISTLILKRRFTC